MKTNIKLITAATALLALTTGCRKELCYNHFRSAGIEISWEHEWERDYGMHHSSTWDATLHGIGYDALRPGLPEGVTMLMYGEGTDPLPVFLPVTGGEVNTGSEGEKSLLFYNNDTEYIILSDVASLRTARATATPRSRSSLGTIRDLHPNEPTINTPDVLYASFVSSLPEIGLHETLPFPVKMQPLVYTYLVRYEFEHGIGHVALARGAIAGMAESVYLRDGATSENSATLLYDCQLTPYGASAQVRSFGIPGFPDEYYGKSTGTRASRRYTLNLEVRLKNGDTKEFTFDISDQMAHQPRGGVITVDGIRVEDDENLNDSGFDVTVNDWGEHEDIDLPIGGQRQ